MNFKRLIFLTALCLLIFLSVSCEDADEVPEVIPPPARETTGDVPQPRVVELQRIKNVPIEFYGAVTDEQGNGIDLAEVTVEVKVHNETPPDYAEVQQHRTWTDLEGRFSFEDLSGSQLTILDISRDGYKELQTAGNPETDYFYSGPSRNLNLPSPERPAAFSLREQVEPVFLIDIDILAGWEAGIEKDEEEDPSTFQFSHSGTIRHDFARKKREVAKAGDIVDRSQFISDMDMTVSLDPGRRGCSVILSTPGDGNGFLVSSKYLQRAPETGYRRKLAFGPTRGRSVSYIYVKSRIPSIYSVINMRSMVKEDSCQLGYTVLVNPYGGTGFEHIKASTEELGKLEKEAVSALNQGKLPAKPVFPR